MALTSRMQVAESTLPQQFGERLTLRLGFPRRVKVFVACPRGYRATGKIFDVHAKSKLGSQENWSAKASRQSWLAMVRIP